MQSLSIQNIDQIQIIIDQVIDQIFEDKLMLLGKENDQANP